MPIIGDAKAMVASTMTAPSGRHSPSASYVASTTPHLFFSLYSPFVRLLFSSSISQLGKLRLREGIS